MMLIELIAAILALSALSNGRPHHLMKRHAGCYSAEDCEHDQICTEDGLCENGDEAVICYGDDECRGLQVCDLNEYICVDPTPAPTEEPEPGCCRGSSYKAQAKCAGLVEQVGCERKDCEWLQTHDPNDCVMSTTSTTSTTEEAGCCAADSARKHAVCNTKESRNTCDRSSSCHWISGEGADCTVPPTTTEDPGCCYGNPDAAYSAKWMESCTAFYTERECLQLTTTEGDHRCHWEALSEEYDCSLLWPTTSTTTSAPGCCRGSSHKSQEKCFGASEQIRCERQSGCEWVHTLDSDDCAMTTSSTSSTTEEPGCCSGDSAKKNSMCNGKESKDGCDRISSCHWIAGEDADCTMPPTTTSSPGCCYLKPKGAESWRWMETCTGQHTERECMKLTDDEGAYRCHWEDVIEGYDCSLLWPTSSTSTASPGCCAGSSYRGQDKCLASTEQEHCERMNSCYWIETEDKSECEMTTSSTTSTTPEPGCCAGDTARTNGRCNLKETRSDCDRMSSCIWKTGNGADCGWTATTTVEPGCCYGNPDAAYSKRWFEACTAFDAERDCLMLTDDDGDYRCHWESTEKLYDCKQLWPSTTTTSTAPGCCRGSSYKAQTKCAGLADKIGCERKQCEWVVTEDPNDCVITTTSTTSTTTTPEPGCCRGGSAKSNDKCILRESRDQCERMSSCHFESGVNADCSWTATTTTEPGCCYGNPDAVYSKRWMEACTVFYAERDCLMLTNDDGDYRCHWEPTDGLYDCTQFWPSTTPEPGCCAGTSFGSHEKCMDSEDKQHCERMNNCYWVSTDDESECEMTTTEEPWMGAKTERRFKGSRKARNKNSESLLFGGETVFGEQMKTTVSMFTVSLCIGAACAVYQLYRWWSMRNGGYTKVQGPQQQQSAV